MDELLALGWVMIGVSTCGKPWGVEKWMKGSNIIIVYCGKDINPYTDITVSVQNKNYCNCLISYQDWKAIHTRLLELERMICNKRK